MDHDIRSLITLERDINGLGIVIRIDLIANFDVVRIRCVVLIHSCLLILRIVTIFRPDGNDGLLAIALTLPLHFSRRSSCLLCGVPGRSRLSPRFRASAA